ncbi:TIM-barrel domain-containing protein [Colwellia sp. RSH04]|uniref:glycoside hydrolase family 31 protein n=1 Tax=Colwellia sp. RSH04 TaxID=2305464 RepID=UPI00217505C5|nr:TIM-barrel domain-containing protein [Colwellia sp. RSH04]
MKLFARTSPFALLFSLVLFVSTFTSTHVLASKRPDAYQSHTLEQQSLLVNTTQNVIRLTAYDNAIEVHYQNDKTPLPSYAIKENATPHTAQVKNTTHKLTFSAGQLTAVITKSPFAIQFYRQGQLLVGEEAGYVKQIQEADEQENYHGFRFHLSQDEKLLGAGERVLGMDRRGHRLPLYNRAHYGYTTESSQMNFSIPAVLSNKKYLLLFDNSAKGWLDIGKANPNILQFSAVSGRSSYIVFSGDNYPDIIHNYVKLTGTQPMPPRWALGNFASRFGYRSQKEVTTTVQKFIDLDIPLDALVLDLYWFGKDIKGHMGNLTWDKETFPAPEKMMSTLKEQGVKTVLITEPFVLTNSKKWQEAADNQALAKDVDGNAKTFDFYFGNTGLIDVFNETGRRWFTDIYKTLDEQGVSGWWGDLGEPEVHPSDTLHTLDNGLQVNADAIHNVYGHQWAKTLYEHQLTLHPNKRPFILMRSGFAGSQRYGMIPWTGDVSRSWGGLQPQVELSLQMSLLGLGYTHSDLGGFAGGESFDKELYIRWLQYGVFQPIYRPHAQDNIAAEVVFHDKETQDILREFIKLRYQLLPYNYTLAYENSIKGMPLMRPLFFEDEQNSQLIQNAQSYLWGDAFLVTPIVSAEQKEVTIQLPKGIWFDYFTGKKYLGNQTITIATSLNTLPVLVRAGSFIPMVPAVQSTQQYSSQALTLHYYADKSVKKSAGKMYEDDGISINNMAKNQYELLHFSVEHAKALTFNFSHQGQYPNMPAQRDIHLVIHHLKDMPKTVSINGRALKVGQNDKAQAIWDATTKTFTIKFTWQHEKHGQQYQQKPLTLSVM